MSSEIRRPNVRRAATKTVTAGLIVLDEIAEGLFGADYDSTRDPEIFGERDPPAREELMARTCSDDALRG